MEKKLSAINDLISLPEAAGLRKCSHQAITELVRKDRFTVREISGHKYLSKREVLSYEPAATGRPRKQKGMPKKKQ